MEKKNSSEKPTTMALVDWMIKNNGSKINATHVKNGRIYELTLNFAKQLCYFEGNNSKVVSGQLYEDLQIENNLAERILNDIGPGKPLLNEADSAAAANIDAFRRGFNGFVEEVSKPNKCAVGPNVKKKAKLDGEDSKSRYETSFELPKINISRTLTEYIEACFENIADSIAKETNELYKNGIESGEVITRGLLKDQRVIRKRIADLLIEGRYSFRFLDQPNTHNFIRIEVWLRIED